MVGDVEVYPGDERPEIPALGVSSLPVDFQGHLGFESITSSFQLQL